MTNKFVISLLFCIAIICTVGSVCADAGTDVYVIDDWGREIILDKPAERIAFGHEAAGEGILLAGAWDKVVGRDASITNSGFYPDLDSIPSINALNQPFNLDLEKVTQLKPDVVILQKYYANKDGFDDIASALEPEITVVGLDFLNPKSAESIKKLGIIAGTSGAADEYMEFHDEVIDSIEAKTMLLSEDEKPNVFIDAVGMGPDQISTYGEDASFWNKMCDIAGGSNVGSDLPSDFVRTVDLEWLLEQDVDLIVVQCWDKENPESFGYMATDPLHASVEADTILTKIKEEDVYSHSDAVKNDNVHLQYWELANNPKSFIGAAYLAKWLHPDLFQDLDPQQIHQKYLTQYIGSDYDLQDVGIFGYP